MKNSIFEPDLFEIFEIYCVKTALYALCDNMCHQLGICLYASCVVRASKLVMQIFENFKSFPKCKV